MSFKSSTLHTGYNTSMQEEWRAVSGWEDMYEVSNLGRVRSIKKKGLIIASFVEKDGYIVVSLKSPRFIKKLHRLVAIAFIPNPENKPQVNHIDSNRSNNYVSNLEWVTPKENTQHSLKVGRISAGEKHYAAKLNNKIVVEIRESKLKTSELAKKYNVSWGTIDSVRNGLTWKNIC